MMRDLFESPVRRASKRLFGTDQPGLVLARWRSAWLRRRYRVRFGYQELREGLRRAGLRRGDTVLLQSRWGEFFNFEGSPKGLIELILDEIGPEGTLAMPAEPMIQDPDEVADFTRAPSRSGLITEVFRRMRGTERSIQYLSSVCAHGPLARRLVQDHHLGATEWDEYSPYFRMIEANALSLTLGLPLFYSTAIHCIDSILKDELPFFANLFSTQLTYSWKASEGRSGTSTFRARRGAIRHRLMVPLFDRSTYHAEKLSNLQLWSIRVPHLVEQGVAMARRGRTCYVDPKPSPRLFRPFSERPLR
jgi:aminoglycoside N3'-acetyltransferase